MAKVEESRHWSTVICGVRSKTARSFPAGLIVTFARAVPSDDVRLEEVGLRITVKKMIAVCRQCCYSEM